MNPHNISTLLRSSSLGAQRQHKPELLDLSRPADLEQIGKILTSNYPQVFDEILSQLKELIKCLNPKLNLSSNDLETKAMEYIKGTPLETYGIWAYYPWSNRLVHILGEEEFTIVRTNRNHYKISPEEQRKLSEKKIGLIGLSVGQSVALAMAMERGFGELRLADFDELELTNLNRIRTGVQNLGVNKAISVAREIAEIDPYLNVKCFEDGLTAENMDSFFTEDGRLDLLIDECDGLDIKVLCRYKARELKIPVVMEASDRGMVDVERFDLEPKRPLLHGLIDDLDPTKLKTLKTNEDKIPYMLAIVGAETISNRAKASMLEIGETITTWPQLASAVALGGGITADVVRRILLNQFSDSGRYYMDVEAIIRDAPKSDKTVSLNAEHAKPDLDFGPEIKVSTGFEVPSETIERIAQAACHAPSGGNLQPWRWTYSKAKLQLYFNDSLRSEFLDHNDIASHIALGASLENAVLAAEAEGLKAKTQLFPDPEQKRVIAHIEFSEVSSSSVDEAFLAEHIFHRETNRNIETSDALSAAHINFLKNVAQKNGSHLALFESEEEKNELGRFIALAEKLRILHPMGHKNFVDEMRWTEEEVRETRDGIDIATCDLSIGELTGFKLARNREVIKLLNEWEGGTAFERLSKKSTSNAAAIGIICRSDDGPSSFVNAGRDMERVWIAANAYGIAFQPQSPLSLMMERLEGRIDLNAEQATILEKASENLKSILNSRSGGKSIFIFRLFYGNKPVVKSLRRDISNQFRVIK